MIDLTKYFEVADEINSKVSSFLLENFGAKKEIFHKMDSHYAVLEDKRANDMYETYLKKISPEVALYTEEGERNLDKELVWVIDPIEGTSNYRAGNPFWATQIGLIFKKEPILAIVHAPFLKQKFRAVKEMGAFLNNKKISITNLLELDKALVDMGRGTSNDDKEWFVEALRKLGPNLRTTRSFGAAGLGISYAAAGITDVYINSGSQIYDLLPASLVVTEAGGKVLNFRGQNWIFKDKGLVVSNEVLAKEVLKIIV